MPANPTLIPGLRSPYEQVGGLVHFGRMLDKIRLHHAGRLPPGWVAALGAAKGFDGRTCRLLHLEYPALVAETLKGGADEQLLAWAFSQGRRPTEEEIEIFNGFLSKLGWNDAYAERVKFRLGESGFPPDAALTMFDFIELDEGRTARIKG